jgi:hypothetical protein
MAIHEHTSRGQFFAIGTACKIGCKKQVWLLLNNGSAKQHPVTSTPDVAQFNEFVYGRFVFI